MAKNTLKVIFLLSSMVQAQQSSETLEKLNAPAKTVAEEMTSTTAEKPQQEEKKVEMTPEAKVITEAKVEIKTEAKKVEVPATTKLNFFGDLRLRGMTEKLESSEERRRNRFQFRAGVKALVSEDLQVIARLMTGSSATSGNVTMGDEGSPGSSRKSIGVDQAYLHYKPESYFLLEAGKFPMPFNFVGKNQLLFDRDMSPEGLNLKLPLEIDENWQLTLVGMNSWVRENYDKTGVDLTDSFLNGAQAFMTWKNSDTSITLGGGSFAFTAIKEYDSAKFVAKARDPNPSQGNTTEVDINSGLQVYPNNFDNSEAFAEIKQKIGGLELGLFYEKVENTNINLLNKAHSQGVFLNYKKWQISYTQQLIEKDAVFALFTDSDFADGFTSSKGSILQLTYKASQQVTWNLTQYNNTTQIDTDFPLKYTKTQLDLLIAF